MKRPAWRTVAWAVLVAALFGVVVGLVSRHYSPSEVAERGERRRAALSHRRMIAAFDSLSRARLYPTVWRLGTFTQTQFDADRKTWTLTISSRDWYARDPASKKDLAAGLLASFRGIRAQAGGASEDAVLIIVDDKDHRVARCTARDGVCIYK